MQPSVSAAQALASDLLSDLPQRWAHTRVVVRHAEEIAFVVGPLDRDVLLATTWLHDIGYSARAHRTGWHSLDGALYLAELDWPERICSLVAHHCRADTIAAARGQAERLAAFPREEGAVPDALVYVEMLSDWDGSRVTLHQRLDDLQQSRVDETATMIAARALRRDQLLRAVAHIEHRLQALGHEHVIS